MFAYELAVFFGASAATFRQTFALIKAGGDASLTCDETPSSLSSEKARSQF
jgi:hypothetical protein